MREKVLKDVLRWRYVLRTRGRGECDLTVWGRLVPPESRKAKALFTIVGIDGVLCLLGAEIANILSQQQLAAKLNIRIPSWPASATWSTAM